MKKIETKPHSTNHSCYRIKKFRSHLISYNITPNFPHLKARLKPHISPRGKRRNYVNSREGLPWQVPILHLKKKKKKNPTSTCSLYPNFLPPNSSITPQSLCHPKKRVTYLYLPAGIFPRQCHARQVPEELRAEPFAGEFLTWLVKRGTLFPLFRSGRVSGFVMFTRSAFPLYVSACVWLGGRYLYLIRFRRSPFGWRESESESERERERERERLEMEL